MPVSDRAFAPLGSDSPKQTWAPSKWPFLTFSMIVTIAICIVQSEDFPGTITGSFLIGGLTGALFAPPLHRMLNERSERLARVGQVFALVGPLFLFGLGITAWVQADGLDLGIAIASLLCIGGIASVYLRRQPAMLVAAQWGIWMGPALHSPSLSDVASLTAAAILTILVARDQLADQRATELGDFAKERAQTRVRDILGDYEETGQGWFWETDRRALLTYLSDPFALAMGRDPDRMIGQPLIQLFDTRDDGSDEASLAFHLSSRSAFKDLLVCAAIEGEDRWWAVSGRPIYDEVGNFVGFRGSGTDLTERKRSEEEAVRLANFDSLTGLSNRLKITRVLERLLKSKTEQGQNCAILLLDLDRFKDVNDTMGHPAGDALLKQVARRLESEVGASGQVGRLGGDEFKIIISEDHDRKTLADLACAVIHSLSQPYSIDGQRIVIGASVGVAVAPDDGSTAEELVRNADLALYAAKDAGRGRHHFYAPVLHAEAEARAQLEEDLRDAMTNGELQLFYQPVVSTASEKINGFEALLRWQHPIKGWIAPDRFIKIAEDTGLILQLGEWTLRTACKELAQMPEAVRVAVNVSPLQFANTQFPGIVTSAIAQSGILPSQLELEITESVFLSDDEGTESVFRALKRIGVRLALDDFGTGYSSLGYLKSAPFDKIKIDQSFLRGATQEGSRNGAIIASITSLAHALGMETTAEGVETLDELEVVRRHGCSHVQGYIYERPLDANAATERLASGLSAIAKGTRSARPSRSSMLRRVVLEHNGNRYDAAIRNISTTGAMIEGLWGVPEGTTFRVRISEDFVVSCKVNWSDEDRMGVEFADRLKRDANGHLFALRGSPPPPVGMATEPISPAASG